MALLLLAGFYTVVPDMRAGYGALVSSVLVIVALLLPIRAVGYFIVRRRAFGDRVLILGTGPLARKLMEEIEARPHYRYRIVGVADDGQNLNDEPRFTNQQQPVGGFNRPPTASLVATPAGSHPFPSRTRPLSPRGR